MINPKFMSSRQTVTDVVYFGLYKTYDTINIKMLLAKVSTLTIDVGFLNVLGEFDHGRHFQCVSSLLKDDGDDKSTVSLRAVHWYQRFLTSIPMAHLAIYVHSLGLATQSVTFTDVEDKLSLAIDIK